MVEGHLQDFSTLATYLKKFKDDQFLEAMSDFHVLVYIATMDMLPLRVWDTDSLMVGGSSARWYC